MNESSQHSDPNRRQAYQFKRKTIELIACPKNLYLELFFDVRIRTFSLHVLQ